MTVSIIVAHDEINAIGLDNKLLWKIPEDMEFFRETTIGSTVIMGRKTFESIGKPLPNRINIVITKKPEEYRHIQTTNFNILFTSKLDEELLSTVKQCYSEKIFIIGGGEIYNYFLEKNLIDKIYSTEVYGKRCADAFFPQYKHKFKLKEEIKPETISISGEKFKINLYERLSEND